LEGHSVKVIKPRSSNQSHQIKDGYLSMEFLLLGLAALFCSPLLSKKEDKAAADPPADTSGGITVIVIGKDGTAKKQSD
jgi:hypothetical protein